MTRTRPAHIIWIILFYLLIPVLRAEAQASDTVGTIERVYPEDDYLDDPDDSDYPFVNNGYGEALPPPDKRIVPEKKLEDLRNQKGMWYVNVEPEDARQPQKKEQINYTPFTRRPWFQTLLWILIVAGFATFLVIYLTGDRIGLFRRAAKKQDSDPSGELPVNIFEINYDLEVQRAERDGDYRSAVRLLFLKTLKIFADRGVLHYDEGKTNFDYLVELHPTSYYEKFFRVTRAYEFTWYGKFHLDEPAYRIVQRDFADLNSMIT